jgi:cytochrome c5
MERQIVKSCKHLLIVVLLLAVTATFAQTSDRSAAQPSSGRREVKARPVHGSQKSEGERVFDENCSRCHNAPEGFSPRISGTIVRHMRVRANLSEKDEQALLRFLNP